MKTPIIDFVRKYSDEGNVRLHMPGHKGMSYLGVERGDITEIDGADVLYSPSGIILESENNATEIFGSGHTYYSAEGSSLSIKAMLAVAISVRSNKQERPLIVAMRNVHKAFVYACALLDADVEWVYPDEFSHLCDCKVEAEKIESVLSKMSVKPCAVYLTSPDYLGNLQDVGKIADICHKFGVLLIVDNAHGAYLKFCGDKNGNRNDKVCHPIDVGADMCCDSAHKTLPVLTGGGYLHVSEKFYKKHGDIAREKLSLFASTSPSYLILQSLDGCNAYLADGYNEKMSELCERVRILSDEILRYGLEVTGDEPTKLVIDARKRFGGGVGLSRFLRKRGIEIEFCDDDFAVMMFTPSNTEEDFSRVRKALIEYAKSVEITDGGEENGVIYELPTKAMTIREAVLGESETIDVDYACGRICASPLVSCPPAVPVVMSGEVIGESQIRLFGKYGIDKIAVVK